MARKYIPTTIRRALYKAIDTLPLTVRLLLTQELDFLAANLNSCDGCGTPFIDRSRNHQRRWCATGGCGNRAKVAAWRDRQKLRFAAAGPQR